jgi:ABC-2 type transport system ATP-binding protein
VGSGEIVGLLGPNGAGKTTTMRMLTTFLAPTSGRAVLAGHDVLDEPVEVRRKVGYLPESVPLYPEMRAREYLDYRARLKDVPRSKRRSAIDRVLERCRLRDVERRVIGHLSKGYRQRVGLADALLHNPPVLILDEPTVGLDPEQRLRFRELIAELGERCTVLLSTHQTEDVMSLCRRVVVLNAGRVRFDGPPAELADVARGRVWLSPQRGLSTVASWRTGDGEYRNLGAPPPGAQLLDPTLEDGYLLLGGADDEVTR